MTSSIFARLNFNYSGSGVSQLSSNTIAFMNTAPKLLDDWQIKDIADNNVNGYQQNPVATSSQSIRDKCNNLVTLLSASTEVSGDLEIGTIYYSALQGTTTAITNLFTSMNTLSANIGGTNGGLFIAHTNRISGVTPIGDDVETKPYYDIALNNGQNLMYITRQSDGISNNAPIIGNFTSLFERDNLSNLNSTISSYYTTINNSITITPGIYDPETLSTAYTRTSSLSEATVSTMKSNIETINTLMAVRRSHDEQFYVNSRAVINDFNKIRTYSDMGSTATDLCQNYVGSSKLLSRLNS